MTFYIPFQTVAMTLRLIQYDCMLQRASRKSHSAPFLQLIDHEAQRIWWQHLNHLLHDEVAMHVAAAVEPWDNHDNQSRDTFAALKSMGILWISRSSCGKPICLHLSLQHQINSNFKRKQMLNTLLLPLASGVDVLRMGKTRCYL